MEIECKAGYQRDSSRLLRLAFPFVSMDYSEKDEQDDNNKGHSDDCLKHLKGDRNV